MRLGIYILRCRLLTKCRNNEVLNCCRPSVTHQYRCQLPGFLFLGIFRLDGFFRSSSQECGSRLAFFSSPMLFAGLILLFDVDSKQSNIAETKTLIKSPVQLSFRTISQLRGRNRTAKRKKWLATDLINTRDENRIITRFVLNIICFRCFRYGLIRTNYLGYSFN